MHKPRLSGSNRVLWRAVIAVAVATAALGVNTGTAQAADVIENAYHLGTGGLAVTWEDGRPNGCDSGGTPTEDFTLVYPTNIGSSGLDNQPIIVWGNGTDATNAGNATCSYRQLLEHWANWGFVVIAPNVAQSGTGDEMVTGAQGAILADNLPSNVFYQNLDTDSMAAAGHSQGALGAINATLDESGMFTSVLAMSTPDRDAMEIYNDPECDGVITQYFCCKTLFQEDCVPVPMPDRVPDMNNLGAPIFFVRGSVDIVSNETATDWYPTASVPHAAASRDFAGHFNLTNAIGYMTAWLSYTLAGDVIARAAFVGSPPELITNTNWDADPITLAFLP